jgi:hypothetical protein
MRRTTLTLAAAFVAALTGLGTLTAAPAEAADGTIVVTPADGAEVPAGIDAITVQFGATDSYEVDVDGPGGYYDWEYHDAQAGQTVALSGFDPMVVAGAYDVTVFNGSYDVVATSSFTVVAPPVEVTNPVARPNVFYPVVRDRFKDVTTVAYTLNRRADVTAQVYRVGDGKRVRSADVGSGSQGAGRRQWTWNGLNNAGQPVGAGRYRIEIEAQDVDGAVSTARVTVTARTETVTRHAVEAVKGSRTSSAGHRGNCFVNRSAYFGETRLDCWGGAYAQATYRFAIPAQATNVRWRVRGEIGCCDRGRIIRAGTRLSPRSYRVSVRVTSWRAFTVGRVSVSYTYRERI